MTETIWKVVPICDYQRLDVRPDDLLDGGDFRRCDTYRGGGGYDQFPNIYERRVGERVHHQFIVQLYGCNLDCPYCYVTRSGVWNPWKQYRTNELAEAFRRSGQEIFHLMGGAPAIYHRQWPELVKALPEYSPFHSDFLLTECAYDRGTIWWLSKEWNCLFAVDIKGVTPGDWLRNTRKSLDEILFYRNLDLLVTSDLPFYLTFTNPDKEAYPSFVDKLISRYGPKIMQDSFIIDLIDYDATPFVDILPERMKIG